MRYTMHSSGDKLLCFIEPNEGKALRYTEAYLRNGKTLIKFVNLPII